MKSKRIIINKFDDINNNYLKITDENNKSYYLEIENGSINCKIITFQGKEVGLQYLETGDFIKIKGNCEKDNLFIIKKIYINTKYDFESESSDDLDFFD